MKQRLIIVGIILSGIVICIFVYNSIVSKKADEPYIEKYSDINKSVLESNFPNNYGGSFLDSKGILNINWVGDNEEKIKNLIKDNEVIINKVQFSLDYLNETKLSLRGKMFEFNIKYMFVGIEENRVMIFINDLTHEKKIKEMVDPNAILIIKTNAKFIDE